MNILIADDERLARERLERMVHQMNDCRVVASVGDGIALWEAVEREAPDIVLLDIDMPGEDGVMLGARLAELDWPPAVIYVTAHPEHALRAFSTHAVDYLLKPVTLDKLQKAVDAACRMNRAQTQARHKGVERLTVRTGRTVQVVPIQSVICFEAGEKYVSACTPEGDYVLDQSLRQLEDQVGAGFLRVHRAAMVAVRCIESLEHDAEGRHWLHLRGLDRRIEVSRRQLRLVKDWLAGESPA